MPKARYRITRIDYFFVCDLKMAHGVFTLCQCSEWMMIFIIFWMMIFIPNLLCTWTSRMSLEDHIYDQFKSCVQLRNKFALCRMFKISWSSCYLNFQAYQDFLGSPNIQLNVAVLHGQWWTKYHPWKWNIVKTNFVLTCTRVFMHHLIKIAKLKCMFGQHLWSQEQKMFYSKV